MQIKGRIFNIQRFSVNDGPGIRTTVFFNGCPLNCSWCHNPECFHEANSPLKADSYSIDEIINILKKDSLFFEESGGGVTFSGGEPLIQKDFLLGLLHACKKIDISTAVDTCGYTRFENFSEISGLVKLFLFDIKIMDEDEHIKYTGVSNGLIIENLKLLSEIHNNIEIRIPLVPGITDTIKNLDSTLQFITSLKNIHKVTLLPYNELAISKYIKLGKEYKPGTLKTQSADTLLNLSRVFSSCGYEVKIRG